LQCVRQSIKEHIRIEPKEESLLNTDQLADYLGVSKPTIHTWKKEGKLPLKTIMKVYDISKTTDHNLTQEPRGNQVEILII